MTAQQFTFRHTCPGWADEAVAGLVGRPIRLVDGDVAVPALIVKAERAADIDRWLYEGEVDITLEFERSPAREFELALGGYASNFGCD